MGHYARLQEIEKVIMMPFLELRPSIHTTSRFQAWPLHTRLQRVVYAIEAASYVMDQLSKEREHIDKRLLHTSATAFLQQIQVSRATDKRMAHPELKASSAVEAVSTLLVSALASPVTMRSCCCCHALQQEAQQFVLAAIKAAAPDRDFEANNYFLMLQVGTPGSMEHPNLFAKPTDTSKLCCVSSAPMHSAKYPLI